MHASRRGFTLLEMLIAVGLVSILATSFMTTTVSCVKMFHGTMAQCELSVRGRELRDKLLFHIRKAENGKTYAGLLSGQNVSVDTVAINMEVETIPSSLTLERNDTQNHRLGLILSKQYLTDDGAPHDEAHLRYLRVGGLSLDKNVDWSEMVDRDDLNVNNRFSLTCTVSAGTLAGFDLGSRTERLIVPLFGKAQTDTDDL